jgi:hypothetical protein
MKIKQYRNLFENWQRHLVEGDESEAIQIVGDVASQLTGQKVVAIDADELEAVEQAVDSVEGEDESEVPPVVDKLVASLTNPIDSKINERRSLLYKIIREELGIIKEDNRGGIEAQKLLVEFLRDLGYDTATSNISGSTTPDVIVGLTKREDGKIEPYAEFEVKSASGGEEDLKLQTTFFDKTLSLGHTDDEAKYFTPILKQILIPRVKKGAVKLYEESETGEKGWKLLDQQDAVNKINNMGDESLVDLALTRLGVDLVQDPTTGKYVPDCGEYGQITARSKYTGYYDLDNVKEVIGSKGAQGKGHFAAQGNWHNFSSSAEPVVFVDDDGKLLYDFLVFASNNVAENDRIRGKEIGKSKPKRGEEQFKVYFLEKATGNYYFASAVEVTNNVAKKLKDYDLDDPAYGNKRYFQLTGSKRGASTSGKFNPKCFKLVAGNQNNSDNIIKEAFKQLKAHWKPKEKEGEPKPKWGGDDYFVVARNIGTAKQPEYNELFIYCTTPDNDPLKLGAPLFEEQI